jgi:hypothetical protein
MLTSTAFAQHVRTPACARCGGSGYVYLCSIPRVWTACLVLDRSTCKRFLLDARSIVPQARSEAAVVHDLRPLVSSVDQRVLQPV